jgi:uncharacterized damage-inducible protein DinB
MQQATELQATPAITLAEMIEYTDWLRERWHEWLRREGDAVLKISAGEHGDGRLNTIGDIVRHIFSAEKRYVDRFSGREITDTSSVPNDDTAALFSLGAESRRDLNEFIATYPAAKWDVPQEFAMMNKTLRATTRKIMVHVLMHEIRHWAQISTMFRQNGLNVEFHDFLFSPVMGDVFAQKDS